MNIFKANKTGLAIFAALMLQLSGLSGYADDGGGQNPAQKATTEVSAGGGSGTMTPDLFTGTMSYSIPIDVPPGRNGMAPDINLLYRSGNGNGWLGVGWELEMGSIVRSLKNGADYNGDDYQFRMAGASLDLVYTGDDGLGNREYRAKIEGAFMRFKKIVDPVLGFPYWEVTDKKGTRYFFGGNASARQYSSSNSNNIFKWCLESVVDTNGNRMSFTYYKNQTDSLGQIYLEQIDYASNGAVSPTNYVKFYRETRTDAADMYTTNFKVKTAYRLSKIEVYANNSLQRFYTLSYKPYSGNTGRSLLTSIKRYGNDGVSYLPATTLDYYDYDMNSIYSNNQTITGSNDMSGHSWSAEYRRLTTGDFNGDGKMDLILQGTNSGRETLLLTGNGDGGFNTPDTITTSYGMSLSLWSAEYRRLIPGDFNGDGKTDILLQGLTEADPTYILIANNNGGFNDALNITTYYNMSASLWSTEDRRLVSGDFNGDGKTDVLIQGFTDTDPTLLLTGKASGGFNDKQDIAGSNGISGNDWGSAYRRISTGDFNGDGKTDVLLQGVDAGRNTLLLLANGQGGFSRQDITGLYLMGVDAWAGNQRYMATGDFNGDGKTDVLLQGSTTDNETLLLTAEGSGGFNDKQTITNLYGMSGSSWSAQYERLVTGDFNGDGKTDILLQGASTGRPTLLLMADGNGGFIKKDITTSYNMSDDAWASNQRYMSTGDFNGDGKTDVLLQGAIENSNTLLLTANTTPQNLLSYINNGLGGITSISYTPSTSEVIVSSPHTRLPFPIQVVSSVTLNDGNGNSSTTNYSYSDGYFHISEKDFRGFNHVTVTGPAADGKQTVMETWFHQGNSITTVTDPLHPENYIEDPTGSAGYMKGKPYFTSVKDGQSNLYSATTTTYVYDNTPPYFNPPSEVITTLYNGSTTQGKQTRTVYDYDPNYGNVRYEYQYGDVSISNDELTIYRTYGENQTEWIVGLPINETVYEGTGTSGAKKSETKYYYDQVADCDAASTNQTPTKGNLTRIERWLDGGTNPETRMAYNSLGNLTCRRDANGNSASIAYDSTYTFPTSTTNALGHVAETRYYGIDGETGNDLYGQVKSVTDPNGAVTSYEYDTFGRKTKTTMPDGSYSTISYNDLGTTSQNIQTSTSAGLSSWTYFDGLGRSITEKSTGPDNKTIATQTVYDARGAVKQKSLPYFYGYESPKYTYYTYDPVGRVTEITNPDNTRVKSCYNDWITVGIDSNNHRKRATKDAYGRLARVEEYTGTFSSCDSSQGTPYATTNYTYDVLGNLLTVMDAKNNQTTMSYDTLGRKTSMHDPDMGNWNYYYDQNGNMTSQLDSMNQWIYFQYDALNRLRQKDYSNQKTLGEGDIVYNYDELNYTQYAKGRLTSMRDQSGTAIIHYDLMGRVIRELKTVTGTTYTTQYGYDQLGRPNAITYPDNTAVNYNYNGPLLSSVYDGSTTYAAYSGYNSLGQPGTVAYGNGVTTSYTYDSNTYRLNAFNTTKSGATYQNMTYGYDNIGNITSITDYTDNNQTHEADKIARLNSLNTAPYTYNSPNGVRPHAVTSAGGSTYHYDNNGNMTIGAGRTITYDPENRPMAINASGTSTIFYYDGNGERVKKATGPTTTVYIGSLYECTNGSCTKYIFANGQRIAAKTNTNTFYYHPDHLGGSSMITDANGSQVEYIAYYPFGQTRIDSGSANVPYKYTGQELDSETGLYNYNARLYDPVLGKFITADSIVPNPGDPQSFNRYSYVRNNPVNYIDPSGHWSIKIGGTKISGDDEVLAATIVVATAAATWYCGGCGAAAVLQGALVGEIAGGATAAATGGNVLQGVVIGGITGGTIGYFTGPIYTPGTISNTYAANEASFNLYNGAISGGTASDAGPIAMGSTAPQFCSGGWCFGIGAAGAGGAAIGSGGGGGGGSRGSGGGGDGSSNGGILSFNNYNTAYNPDRMYTGTAQLINSTKSMSPVNGKAIPGQFGMAGMMYALEVAPTVMKGAYRVGSHIQNIRNFRTPVQLVPDINILNPPTPDAAMK